jgi:DNA-binding transcriptional LysR family regulator
MVGAGLGLGILPDHCARPFAAALGYRCVGLEEGWARYSLSLGIRHGETLPALARLFLAHLLDQAAAQNSPSKERDA